MTTEELCDKALAAGHNCTVTITTGPVDTGWAVWVFPSIAVAVLFIVMTLAFDSWQEHRTKRNEADVRAAMQLGK